MSEDDGNGGGGGGGGGPGMMMGDIDDGTPLPLQSIVLPAF